MKRDLPNNAAQQELGTEPAYGPDRSATAAAAPLRFGCRTCSERFLTIRERNEHEDMTEACEPRTTVCFRCGGEATLDAMDWAVCSECNQEWTA